MSVKIENTPSPSVLMNSMRAIGIEQGIILSTTKDRLLQLENEKKELSALIAQEQIKAPFLTKNQIMFFFKNLRKTNIKTKEGKQALIDVLIKTVFVYDDEILITFNYKDSTRTVSLSEVAMSSDNRNAREPAFSDKKAVANKKSEIYSNLVLFLSKTLHVPLNIEILCKNKVGQKYSNLELSFYIIQDSS